MTFLANGDIATGVGVRAGLGEQPPPSEYLPAATLDMFLVHDDETSSGDEAQEYITEYVERLLREAGLL